MLLMKKVFALWVPLLVALAEPAVACTTVRTIMDITALQGSTATLCPFDFTNDNGGCGPTEHANQKIIRFEGYPDGYTGKGGVFSITTTLTCQAGGTCKIRCPGYNRIALNIDYHNRLNLIGGFHFEGHTAGAIRNNGAILYVKGATFKDNQGLYGAAILTWKKGPKDVSTTVEDCLFDGNSADHYGGALYGQSTTLKVIGCTFKNNKAPKYGGAVFAERNLNVSDEYFSQVEITSSTFEGNTAPWGPTIGGLGDCQVVFKTDISTGGTAFIGTSSCDGVAIGSDDNCDTAPIVPSDFATCPKANTLPADFFSTPAPMTPAPTTPAPTTAPADKPSASTGYVKLPQTGSGGKCPVGTEVAEAACVDAGKSLGGALWQSELEVGDWDFHPCGCSINKNGHIIFDNGSRCAPDGPGNLVCSAELVCNQDAKECPDGSFVGRLPELKCEFIDCLDTKQPPTKAPSKGSGSGDPHFQTWTGNKFDYHGECDLVLVNNPTFADGLGLRVHIRTTRIKYFSFIEKVAIQLGNDVLEFDNDVENFLINGLKVQENRKYHKTSLSGFFVRRDPAAISIRLHKEGKAKIDLHTRKNGFPAVIVDGGSSDIFEGSLGLLGEWKSGKKLARNGVTEMNDEDATAFALEWQVQGDEPLLFKEARFPQFPIKCTPPVKMVGGRLGSKRMQEEAEKVCAHWKMDMEDCIFDVVATRDVAVAAEGHLVHIE